MMDAIPRGVKNFKEAAEYYFQNTVGIGHGTSRS